jgi:hypothetical protein
MFDVHNSIWPKRAFNPTCQIGSLLLWVNSDVVRLWQPPRHCILLSTLRAEPRAAMCASFPFRNRRFPFLSSPPKWKHWRTPLGTDHFSSTASSPLPPPPNKWRREPHNPSPHPFLTFPLGFSCVRTLSRQSSSHCRHHSSLPDRIRHFAAVSYGRWGPWRAHLPPQASTVSYRASQPPHARSLMSSWRHRSTVNRTVVTIYGHCTRSMSFLIQK